LESPKRIPVFEYPGKKNGKDLTQCRW